MIAGVLLAAAAIYFYNGDSSQKTALSAPPPLKLRSPSTASGFKTIAVLPFTGTDAKFAKSFSDGLSIRLGSANKFEVKSPALVEEYAVNGAELKTDLSLRGNVEPASKTYVARVTLEDTNSGKPVWSDTLEFDNLIQLQDAVANRTINEVLARLTNSEKELIAKRLPSNLSAYENFQTGSLLWRRRADGSAQLRRAIELDQSFAPAYAMLANIVATRGVKDSPAAAEAQDLLNKAFALDENLPNGYAVQGLLRIFHHRDWAGAEASLKSALELDPNNVNAHHWLGVYYSIHRRLDEAKAEMKLALDIDPTNPTLLGDIGQLHYFAGEPEVAVDFFKKATSIDRSHPFANEYLNSTQTNSSVENEDIVLDNLEKAAELNSFVLPYINVDPRYDPVRNTARFQRILRRMNL